MSDTYNTVFWKKYLFLDYTPPNFVIVQYLTIYFCTTILEQTATAYKLLALVCAHIISYMMFSYVLY